MCVEDEWGGLRMRREGCTLTFFQVRCVSWLVLLAFAAISGSSGLSRDGGWKVEERWVGGKWWRRKVEG